MKNLIKLIMATAFVTFTTSVSAIPLTTVGGVDTLVDYTSLGNSGDAGELQFFADYLGVDSSTLTLDKVSGSAGTGWVQVDGTDLWSFDFLDTDPSLFLVKMGENTGITLDDPDNAEYDTFLYLNETELGYGVIDLNIFTRVQQGSGPTAGQEFPIDIFRVSHVSVTTTVPEPSIIALLAVGLVGMGIARRRTRV